MFLSPRYPLWSHCKFKTKLISKPSDILWETAPRSERIYLYVNLYFLLLWCCFDATLPCTGVIAQINGNYNHRHREYYRNHTAPYFIDCCFTRLQFMFARNLFSPFNCCFILLVLVRFCKILINTGKYKCCSWRQLLQIWRHFFLPVHPQKHKLKHDWVQKKNMNEKQLRGERLVFYDIKRAA